MEFGELVEPTTRAFWDDYDEYQEDSRSSLPVCKWMDEESEAHPENTAFDKFYIIEGQNVFDFVNKTVLKNAQPVCQIDTQKTSVYSFAEHGYSICVAEDNDLNMTGHITQLLTTWLEKAVDVIAITVQPAYVYNSTKNFDRRCFIRSLGTNTGAAGQQLNSAEPIGDCNIVHGISAGASSWRHFNGRTFNCYAVYIDCPVIDSVASEPILKLFHDVGVKCDSKYTPSFANNSNLYI